MLARVVLKLFFRRIEVEGRSSVPAAGPVLFVCNHTNAFVDALLLMITLRRPITLTAKNVLAGNPLLGILMKATGVISFHRREDAAKGADPRRNAGSLEQCRDVLREGGALCIFPEGVSHSDPSLRPFRTGAARIALDYVRQDGNPGALQIVPVALLYEDKDQFRSAVWLRYGEPLDIGAWLADHAETDAQTLTEELLRRVEAVTLNYQTRRESAILSWGAEILATDGEAPRPLGWREGSVAAWFQLLSRLQTGYHALLSARPAEVEALTRRVRQYRAELRRLGIAPDEVYLPMHRGKALFFLFRELELLLIGAPFALFGFVNHAAPYYLVKWIAKKLSKDKDHWATNVVFPSFAIFPLCYALQIAAAWSWLPALWAALYTIALPYTGYLALLYCERLGATLRRLRTFTYFLNNRERQRELAGEGRDIIAAVRALGRQVETTASVEA
jgi:1-acyl-sn-glycerol-3-phosphate acyltransferase